MVQNSPCPYYSLTHSLTHSHIHSTNALSSNAPLSLTSSPASEVGGATDASETTKLERAEVYLNADGTHKTMWEVGGE